ncbi:MAG: OsmC family protein [Promethearchaeota archaeon]
MLKESRVKVGIKLEEEMTYKCDLGKIKMEDLFIDETHKRYSNKIGPNPTSLLALSVLSCLAASFTFCLKKKGFTLEELNGKAEVVLRRNKKGFWRLKKIYITITPTIDDPNIRKRADICMKFFEQYCIISESLRDGMEVDVKIDY